MASILDQVKGIRAAQISSRFTNLELPAPWGTVVDGHPYPRAWLRIEPVSSETIKRFQDRAVGAKGAAAAGALLRGNLSIVAAAAVEVVLGEGEDQASYTLDNPEFLETLEIPDAASKSQVVMALVGADQTKADGHVFALSVAVVEHSGYTGQVVSEETLGE